MYQGRKNDDSKGSYYEELEQVFDHFLKFHMKILLGDLMQKWGQKIFLHRHLEMRVYNRTVITTVLE